MSNIQIHCGGEVVPFEMLANYPIPEKTRTYQPVSHTELATLVKNTSQELLRLNCVQEHYAVARDGQRLFALQTFDDGLSDLGMGISVGFRNSYDKSMSLGLAMGFKVFVCDNLAISGEITIMRKHTKNVWQEVDQALVHTLYRKGPQMIDNFRADVTSLQKSVMDELAGFEFLGRLFGLQILSPTQMSVAANEWRWQVKSQKEAGGPTDAWQLYNAVTHSLKSTPPQHIMERHKQLHGHLLEYAV